MLSITDLLEKSFVGMLEYFTPVHVLIMQAMSERNREIAVHKDMLKAQIKSCESERQTVR